MGIYPSHLNICSCHRLLSHMSQAQVEEALKLVTEMQITVYRCDCPGVIQETGTDFKLALIWQLPSNPRQILKKRQVLFRPQYIFGSEESRLRLIYRGDKAGQFFIAMASRADRSI